MTSKKKKQLRQQNFAAAQDARHDEHAAPEEVAVAEPEAIIAPEPETKSDHEELDVLADGRQQLTVEVPDPPMPRSRHESLSVPPPSPPIIPVSSTCHSSGRPDRMSASASPSPSIASLPTIAQNKRDSNSSLNRVSSPRQSTRDFGSYNKGIVVKPQSVPTFDAVLTALDFVQEIIPLSSQATTTVTAPEKIEWVEVQKVPRKGDAARWMDIIIVGLAHGLQVWSITDSGVCEEVISERQGPIRIAKIMHSNPIHKDPNATDKFAESRPLMGIIDSSHSRPENQFCNMSFVALATGKIVHKINFEEPIAVADLSCFYLVAGSSRHLFVCDNFNLNIIKKIALGNLADPLRPAFALQDSVLAFPDTKIMGEHVSVGGCARPVDAPDSSYTSQVFSAMKTISKTVQTVSGFVKNTECKGILSLVDLHACTSPDPEEFYKMHFLAQIDPISHIDISPDGRLLVTVDSSACEFNVFLLLPHSGTSSLAAAQHLYVLSRGSTTAKIQSSCFSSDSRWFCASTNHGTVHLFALCPYGGKPTTRTHGKRVVNQQTRFTRSAGLTLVDGGLSTYESSLPVGKPIVPLREHPLQKFPNLARLSGNPRIGPFPAPILLYAVKRIRDNNFNSDNLSAWAADLTHNSLTTGKKLKAEMPKMAVTFSSKPVHDSRSVCILVMRVDGVLCEYSIKACDSLQPEDAIKIKLIPEASWSLYRTRNTVDIVPPLQQLCPLMRWLTGDPQYSRARSESHRSDPRTDWNLQIEDNCTYSAPHRRFWQGPQVQVYLKHNNGDSVVISPFGEEVTQTIPIEIKTFPHNSGSLKNEWSAAHSSEQNYSNSHQDEISRKIADAMGELKLGNDSNNIEIDRAEKSSIDDVFFDSTDQSSVLDDSHKITHFPQQDSNLFDDF